jgi:hypothetical protein
VTSLNALIFYRIMKPFGLWWVLLYVLKVESFHKADLSVFGSCVLHIKRFREEVRFLDLTSLVIEGQFANRDSALFSVYNGSDMTSQIQPAGNVREECSLNIMLGMYSSDAVKLYNFMYTSGYTFSSNPRSIYVIVLDSNTRSVSVNTYTVRFPVSIFAFMIPTESIGIAAGINEEPRIFYVCLRCGNTMELVKNPSNIRDLSDSSYEGKWVNRRLTLQVITERVGIRDITLCESYIWKMWLAPLGDDRRGLYKYCWKSYAYMDLLARTVHSNVTVFVQGSIDVSKDNFVGLLFHGSLNIRTQLDRWFTSSVYLHIPGFGSITYCHNEKHFATITLWSWMNCFTPGVWVLIFGVVVSVQMFAYFRHPQEEYKRSVTCYIGSIFEVFAIVFRQGNCKCAVLAVFSLGIMIVVSLFENDLTSCLIAPTIQPEHTLKDVVDLGYSVLYKEEPVGFYSQLPELEALFIRSNVPIGPSSFQILTTAIWNEGHTFSYHKMAYYAILTPSNAIRFRKLIQSKVPGNFTCRTLKYTDPSFSPFSAHFHDMKVKFFYVNELIMQAGIDQLFDQDLVSSTPSYAEETMIDSDMENEQIDEFLSLKYLFNFFYLFGCVCFTCSVIFMVEACLSQVNQVMGAIVHYTRLTVVYCTTTLFLRRSIRFSHHFWAVGTPHTRKTLIATCSSLLGFKI